MLRLGSLENIRLSEYSLRVSYAIKDSFELEKADSRSINLNQFSK